MGKSSPKPPPAPDPTATAQAQAEANRIDQFTPFGNIVFSGDNRNTATTTLSPEAQNILNLQLQGTQALGDRANQLIPQLPSGGFQIEGQPVLPSDFSEDRQRVEQATFDRISNLLNPQFDRQENRLMQSFANRGLPIANQSMGEGSAANAELDVFNRSRNQAFGDAALQAVLAGGQEQSRQFQNALTGRQQGLQEQQLERSVPLNEILTLMGLQQVQQPNFFGPGSVDVVGAQQQALNQGNAAAQLGAQQNSSMLSGLTSLGGAALGAGLMPGGFLMASDRRVKTSIKRVGVTDNGLPVYTFRYKTGGPVQMGVMAQDLEKVNPSAVHEINGIKMVDYREVA